MAKLQSEFDVVDNNVLVMTFNKYLSVKILKVLLKSVKILTKSQINPNEKFKSTFKVKND